MFMFMISFRHDLFDATYAKTTSGEIMQQEKCQIKDTMRNIPTIRDGICDCVGRVYVLLGKFKNYPAWGVYFPVVVFAIHVVGWVSST